MGVTAQDEGGEPREAGRLESVDLLRGLVIVLMTLDHFRDYFSDAFAVDATDLTRASAALFLTRWITHFCAPVFVFLAGTSAFLARQHGEPPQRLAGRLLRRGLWLVALELLVTSRLLFFAYDPQVAIAAVIWAIGWSMVALSAMVYLPTGIVAVVGLGVIAAHNLLDHAGAATFGTLGWLHTVLHARGDIPLPAGITLMVVYPLVPWFAVMASGYAFGWVLRREAPERLRWCLSVGAAAILLFAILRGGNLYGDPAVWQVQPTALRSLFSFINCTKYPPSLLYLLMTLGPAVALFPLWERWRGRLAGILMTYGRVPLFFYVSHLVVLHALVSAHSLARYGAPLTEVAADGFPAGYGYSLPVVYAVTMAALAAIYPVCRWYANAKRASGNPWLRYL